MNTKNESVYKLIRLNTGEDIIGHCMMDDVHEFVLVANPMKVIIRRLPDTDQTVLMMLPWLPLELIDEDIAEINYADIITMVKPKDSFVEYYNETVIKYEGVMEERQDESIFDYQEEESEESSFDNMMDELLNFEEEKKNQTLH